MTELEWCKENAPDSLKNADEETLLSVMHDVYLETVGPVEEETLELNPINNNLDYIVIEMCKAFGNKIAVHGGYMMTKFLPDVARQTRYVDLDLYSADIETEVLDKLKRIAEELVSVGVIDSYRFGGKLNELTCCGIEMYKDNKKILSADIGLRDLSFGTKVYSLSVGDINAHVPERMVCDKMSAMLSDRRCRRSKDLYDIYYLTEVFNIDIEFVYNCTLECTMQVAWDNFPLSDEEVVALERAYGKLKVTSIYKDVDIHKPLFSEVFERLSVLVSRCKSVNRNVIWDCTLKDFRRC